MAEDEVGNPAWRINTKRFRGAAVGRGGATRIVEVGTNLATVGTPGGKRSPAVGIYAMIPGRDDVVELAFVLLADEAEAFAEEMLRIARAVRS